MTPHRLARTPAPDIAVGLPGQQAGALRP